MLTSVTVGSTPGSGDVQPVFNLEIPGRKSFFVGVRGALVHDNTPVDPVPLAFDAEPVPAATRNRPMD
jgi:hypothetical protein